MRSVRLIPVVIFAALALLVFKSVALLTSGSYVLTGTVEAAAEEHGSQTTSDAVTGTDATYSDGDPTLADTAPTVVTKPEAKVGGHGGEDGAEGSNGHGAAAGSVTASDEEHTSSAEHVSSGDASGSAETEHGSSGSDNGVEGSSADASCEASSPAHGEAEPASEGSTACASSSLPTTADGDAIATTNDGKGNLVPLASAAGEDNQSALLATLAQRRAELDKRAADLKMRSDIVAAAEKKLDDRTKTLQDLEAKVNALVDQKQAEADAEFKAVVSMYETMKPKDAATVFNALDMPLLLKLARSIPPRKMAAILPAMDPKRAQDLTTLLASTDAPPVSATPQNQVASLPQIVGH